VNALRRSRSDAIAHLKGGGVIFRPTSQGSFAEALSAYERLCATYPGEEAKGRMALLLQRTGAEQRARAIFAEIRKSIERGPAFYRRRSPSWRRIDCGSRRHLATTTG
jgi:hypothetical protein